MHKAILLSEENAKLRAANNKQKAKKQGRSKYVSKKKVLTIAQGQEMLRTPEIPVAAPVQPRAQPAVRVNPGRLLSCWKCYGFDYIASACPVTQAS